MNRIIVWHRRDLRLDDNTALHHALRDADEIVPLFILADDILKERDDFSPACVRFMLDSLEELCESYKRLGGKFILRRGRFLDVLRSVVHESDARGIYFNEDYEPAAKLRDACVKKEFSSLSVKSFKDQVCFAGREILTGQGNPYTVFTPYKKNWLSQTGNISTPVAAPNCLKTLDMPSIETPTLKDLGLDAAIKPLTSGGESVGKKTLETFIERKIERYKEQRDQPSIDGTSLLSAHLRFGTVSVRRVFFEAMKKMGGATESAKTSIETFVSELIWRDFYFQILDNFPHVERESFKPETRALKWENRDDYFEAWKAGKTGFPIVDAAMRQLHQTGWMHNRLRMIVASFLTKDLLIDWRWGEKYFMQTLIDGDMAANNGGWQWSASTGTDAQPYFRIFNPTSQSEKFDPKGAFIKAYLPELRAVPEKYIHDPTELLQSSPLLQADLKITLGKDYPAPIVDHKVQREKALQMFKAVKASE